MHAESKHTAQHNTLSGPDRTQHSYLYMYCICTVYVLYMYFATPVHLNIKYYIFEQYF